MVSLHSLQLVDVALEGSGLSAHLGLLILHFGDGLVVRIEPLASLLARDAESQGNGGIGDCGLSLSLFVGCKLVSGLC